MKNPDRRKFLRKSTVTLVGGALLAPHSTAWADASTRHPLKMNTPLLITNQYPWFTFYRRQGINWQDHLDTALPEIRKSGADSLEPLAESVEQLQDLCRRLKRNALAMQTVYVNSVLHDADRAEASIETALELARLAKSLMGTRILVTNPSPIRWGGPENKTDGQLELQATSLQALGKALHEEGIDLAYHFHEAEFREGAREVHHMLASTDPRYVKLCLDAHWAFRGAGNSNVALHDIVRLYGDRVVELHVRQSVDGIWTEAFGEGDIDYGRLVRELSELGARPVVCMEQSVESDTPDTMNSLQAHTISHRVARTVFKPFLT